MLNNVLSVEELRSLARRKMNSIELKSVPVRLFNPEEEGRQGWRVQREGETVVRLSRPKARSVLLEDRVWSLLYRLGFSHLSADRGAQLTVDPKAEQGGPQNQIDVVGLDLEVAVAVECKSAEHPRRYTDFQKDLAKHALLRERFAAAVSAQFPLRHKRVPVMVFFTWDLILSENDVDRARNDKVVLLNERDLQYYENLASHLGPAAKYQLFSDMLPGRRIYGLTAVRLKLEQNQLVGVLV